MVEDETEVLDWGNEEEDRETSEQDPSLAAEDAEDAVSLGGDEDDEFLTYQPRVSQGAAQRTQSPSKTVNHPEKNQEMSVVGTNVRGKAPEHDKPQTPARPLQETQTVPEPSPALNRQLSFGKLTHALPPKPIVSSVPFMHPSHPSIIEATAMAARVDRDKKNGTVVVSKPTTFESGDILPSDWEVRHPRNGRGVYYYNSRTKESTWTRPGSSPPARDRRVADETRDIVVISKTDDSLTSRIGRSDAGAILSYDDRHYRPGESARRDERLPMQSYGSQNDSFLASNRANGERSVSPPSRHRADDRVSSSRRQRSLSTNGDQNRGRASTKDIVRPGSPIADVDRVWVAPRVPSPVHRPASREGKHREAEQPPHKEHERRETPRDADRMSTTRPRSPVSHSRDVQYPPTLPPSNDTDVSRNELSSAARQQSRFIQAPSAEIDQRIQDLPDKPPRQPRPQTRSLSADETRPRHRTSDRHKADARAHESPDMAPQTLPQAPQERLVPPTPSPPIERSRKRVPLPPQRDSFQEGSRGKADVGYRSPPSGTRDSAPASRLITNDARIPSGPRQSPLETSRDIRSSDARGARQAHFSSAPYQNSQTDTHAHNESRDKRGKDQMDVDDSPPTSIVKSTETSRQLVNSQRYREDRDGSAPKRPRAMMDDVEMSSRRRSPDRSPKPSRSEWKEPHRTAYEDVSRAAPSRDDRRAPIESSTRTSRDTSRRHVDMSRPPPSAPTPKLSGTNSMPIGGRGNRFGGSASISPHPPLPSAPFLPPASSASRRGSHLSGSNAQPVVSRPVRPPSGMKDNHDRPSRLDVVYDRERPVKISADQRRQTERVVSPLLPRKPLSVPDPPANVPINTDSPSRLGARAARTRFGPPVPEPEGKPHLDSRRDQTPESPRSHHHDDHATPPPLSRDSSMTSARDAAHPSQQSKHDGDVSLRGHRVPEPRSHAPERKEAKDLPEYPRSSGRNDRHDYGPSSLDHAKEWRVDDSKNSKWSRSRDLPPHESSRHADVESLPSGQHAANGEGSHQSLPLAMHPERARLLQNKLPHSLPPRPDTEPRRPRSTRPRHDSTPWAPPSSRSNQHLEETSFPGDRFDRPSNNHGSSLIDRLGVDGGQSSFSLRDRVKVPMKRPSDDLPMDDALMDVDDGQDGSKRSRRRGGKLKKPRRVA